MSAARGKQFHVALTDRVLPVCVFVPDEHAGWYTQVRFGPHSREESAM